MQCPGKQHITVKAGATVLIGQPIDPMDENSDFENVTYILKEDICAYVEDDVICVDTPSEINEILIETDDGSIISMPIK